MDKKINNIEFVNALEKYFFESHSKLSKNKNIIERINNDLSI